MKATGERSGGVKGRGGGQGYEGGNKEGWREGKEEGEKEATVEGGGNQQRGGGRAGVGKKVGPVNRTDDSKCDEGKGYDTTT